MTELQRRKERIDRGIKVRTDGLYALMSWRELGYLTLPRLLLIAGMLALPFLMPSMYWQRVISIVCIYSLLALSFDLLAHFQPVAEIVRHVVPAEGQHRHWITPDHADSSCRSRSRFRTHAGTHEDTVLPVECLIHKRNGY